MYVWIPNFPAGEKKTGTKIWLQIFVMKICFAMYFWFFSALFADLTFGIIAKSENKKKICKAKARERERKKTRPAASNLFFYRPSFASRSNKFAIEPILFPFVSGTKRKVKIPVSNDVEAKNHIKPCIPINPTIGKKYCKEKSKIKVRFTISFFGVYVV